MSRPHPLLPIVVALALLPSAAGCAVTRFVPPEGPGRAAPDGHAIWAEATRGCRAVRTYSATMFLSIRAGGEGYPTFTVFSGLTDAGAFLLQGRGGGQRIFDLAGRPDRATLVLYGDERFVEGPADLVFEAATGIGIGPERLLAVLTGCVSTRDAIVRAARHGDLLEIETGDGRVFLHERDGQWRPRAGMVDGLDVVFTRIVGGWPQEVSVFTPAGQQPEASLRVVLDSIQINVELNPAAFVLAVPEGYAALTLDELRAGGPLRERGGG